MATSNENITGEFVLPEKKTVWDTILRMLRKQPLGSAGAIVIIVMAFAAIFADYVAPFDPNRKTLNSCYHHLARYTRNLERYSTLEQIPSVEINCRA